MSIENTLDCLNEFYRGEKAAVETYDRATKSTKDPTLGRSLTQIRESHAERVNVLRNKICELAGQPSETSGVWGAFAKAVQAGADLLGDSVALAALEEGEDRGIKQYTEAMRDGDAIVRDLVGTVLLPAQRQSHDLCRALKSYVKAA
jgi:uncharacterized protein (TIGR02284 family)